MHHLHQDDGMYPWVKDIYYWTKEADIEREAMEQARRLSRLPFTFGHVALMPDCHSGYGMPIGGVLATQDYIIPNAVGVDIGCGVMAVKTTMTDITEEQIKAVLGRCRELIPVGFKHRNEAADYEAFYKAPPLDVVKQELDASRYQIGTLGGGNHFIEIQKGSDGRIWLMIHSGSRNIGYRVANYYNRVAKSKLIDDRIYMKVVLPEWDLAFLKVDSQEGQEYLAAMDFCLQFAFENRQKMMDDVLVALDENCDFEKVCEINVHHNYVAHENHFGHNVWVHRKGATSARDGQVCLIPGSMGTASYIGIGLGNKWSFNSCSHGAGRVMSRTKANETITEEMANQSIGNVVFGRWNGDYSECPLAYKNVDQVMKDQEDLVRAEVKLTPLGVMKG